MKYLLKYSTEQGLGKKVPSHSVVSNGITKCLYVKLQDPLPAELFYDDVTDYLTTEDDTEMVKLIHQINGDQLGHSTTMTNVNYALKKIMG